MQLNRSISGRFVHGLGWYVVVYGVAVLVKMPFLWGSAYVFVGLVYTVTKLALCTTEMKYSDKYCLLSLGPYCKHKHGQLRGFLGMFVLGNCKIALRRLAVRIMWHGWPANWRPVIFIARLSLCSGWIEAGHVRTWHDSSYSLMPFDGHNACGRGAGVYGTD